MALSPILAKKFLEPYLISYLVLSTLIPFATATITSPCCFTEAAKEIGLVMPLMVKFPLIVTFSSPAGVTLVITNLETGFFSVEKKSSDFK